MGSSAVDDLVDGWFELRLGYGVDPHDVHVQLGDLGRPHHFWDEPWWPDRYVMRVESFWWTADGLRGIRGVEHVDAWDHAPDETHYGDDWPAVRDLFHTASMLARVDERTATRLVHCLLNARGMSERDEARWALSFAWGRLTIKLRWRLYLRRRWEREAR